MARGWGVAILSSICKKRRNKKNAGIFKAIFKERAKSGKNMEKGGKKGSGVEGRVYSAIYVKRGKAFFYPTKRVGEVKYNTA